MISIEQKRFFEANGYVQLKGIIDESSCERMIEKIWSLVPAPMDRHDPDTWSGYIQDCCNNLPMYQRKGLLRFKDRRGFRDDPVMSEEIHGNARLQDALSELLGMPLHRIWVRGLHPVFPMPDKVTINEALGNRFSAGKLSSFKIPRPPQPPIAPHLDVHAMDVGAIVYLNDVDENGGALGVWPGSHRLFNLAFDSEIEWNPTPFYKRAYHQLRGYKPKLLGGNRGDVIIFHNRLLHTNTLNKTSAIRHAVLIDVLGEKWENRNMDAPAGLVEERNKLDVYKSARHHRIVKELTAAYEFHPAAFITKHALIGTLLNRIAQDPVGAQRRFLSRKIRERKEGEVWIVVSPAGEWQNSPKLDAYGDPKGARFTIELNGKRAGRSNEGIMIQKLDVRPGANRIRIRGKTRNRLYVRVVGTSNPVHQSPILLRAVMDVDSRELGMEFVVPEESDTGVDQLYDLGVANNKIATPLPDGSYYPSHLSNFDVRPMEFIEHFNRVREKPWEECSFLDLGCSEGAGSFTISQTGARVIGVEGRADAIVRAQALTRILGYTKTEFMVGNVLNPGIFTAVDGIFAASIINHLEEPLSFLRLCADHARSFIYFDSAHMPRDSSERSESRFQKAFGKQVKLSLDGIEIDAIEFDEPKDVSERHKGGRRHPRSGIGNKVSLLLSHDALIGAMEKLGFPYHETIEVVPSTPRMRTVFFRKKPRELASIDTFSNPLPPRHDPYAALCVAARRDASRLATLKNDFYILGDEPKLSEALQWLKDHGLSKYKVIALPKPRSKPIPMSVLRDALKNAKGHLVIAGFGINDLYEKCMLLDRFDYIYGGLSGLLSFSKE